ncbi:MAG: chromosomal replication initiator protein DnaA [Ignavibacteria bacterium]|nr:chromosomal replication initiator protein DnaA [Ignavibacteria bacterium]
MSPELMEKSNLVDHSVVWKNCLSKIKDNVTLMTYNTWFLPIKPIQLSNSVLKVELPSQFFWEWIEEHYNSLINKTISEVIGPEAQLSYIINEISEQQDNISENKSGIKIPVVATTSIVKHNFESFLNTRYTFDNFITGEGNQLARAAAGAISDNPGGTSFNPFFVYGGVGLGKTHLIQAIGNEIVKNFPNKKVIYLSTDIFTVEFVEAIQSNRVNDFSNFYRSMDVLIIDDIQFLIGKEKTQDLFFHIFNILHQLKKQIILSSDKPPKNLKGLDERLTSRFQWGLTADIQPPELETRIAILKKKAEAYGMQVSSEILDYIATNITSNIRELEGCLIKILANSSLSAKEITFELVRETVKEIATDKKIININIDSITKIVCDQLNVAENKMREKTRKKEVVQARQIAMYLSKEMTNSSLKTIGLHFGGRDHSTVVHACGSIENAKERDGSFKKLLKELKNQIELNSV